MKNITFWKDENWKLIHISQVISWKKCWVYCLISWKPLIARKWNKNSHHFAHYEWFNYQYYKETLVHLLAKKTLKETKRISLPYLIWTNYMMRTRIDKIEQNEIDNFLELNKELKIIDKIEFADYLVLENIEVEKRIPINNDYIIADIYWEIIVESEIIPIIIEIMVSHPCDENKINKFKGTNYCVIEVDCNLMDEDLQNDENHIKNVLIEIFQGKYGKTFLYLPIKYENLVKKYLDEIEKINDIKNQKIKLEMIKSQEEYKKKLIHLSELWIETDIIPLSCPIRKKVYGEFYKLNKELIEESEWIKLIFNNTIYWDFKLHWNSLNNASLFLWKNEIKFFKEMNKWWDKYLLFKQMYQKFIHYQAWKFIKTFRNWSRVVNEINWCKNCSYFRREMNNEWEINDYCSYHVNN